MLPCSLAKWKAYKGRINSQVSNHNTLALRIWEAQAHFQFCLKIKPRKAALQLTKLLQFYILHWNNMKSLGGGINISACGLNSKVQMRVRCRFNLTISQVWRWKRISPPLGDVSQGYYSLTSIVTNIEAEPFQNHRLRAERPETCNNDSFSEGTAWSVLICL